MPFSIRLLCPLRAAEGESAHTVGQATRWATMDPTAEELLKINSIDEAMKWIGMKQGLRKALEETMRELAHFREIVLCPEAAWSLAGTQLRVVAVEAMPGAAAQGAPDSQGHVPARLAVPRVDRPLNVLEAAQVVSLRRVARLRLNQPAEEVPSAGAGLQQQQAASASAPPAAHSKSAARISEVIDQSDHSEVTPWGPERVRAAMAVFKAGNKGVAAKGAYAPTALQFAALEFKLRTAGMAYVDFGVWRPNGGRLERRMRLTIHQRNEKGDWIPCEIAGPSCFMEWQRGWRVFTVAMRALDEADQPSLDEFEEAVQELVQTFGEQCWWIVAQGEGRMRSERMPALMDEAIEDKEKAVKKGEPHAFEERRPWNYLFRKAAVDREFWQDQVKDKCMRWLTKIENSSSVAEEGFGPVHPGNSGLTEIQAAHGVGGGRKRTFQAMASDSSDSSAGAPVKKKKKANKHKKRIADRRERAAGKAGLRREKPPFPPAPPKADKVKGKGKGKGKLHAKTAAGTEICYKYAKDGACAEPCPQKRAHVCERCLQRHRTSECKAS